MFALSLRTWAKKSYDSFEKAPGDPQGLGRAWEVPIVGVVAAVDEQPFVAAGEFAGFGSALSIFSGFQYFSSCVPTCAEIIFFLFVWEDQCNQEGHHLMTDLGHQFGTRCWSHCVRSLLSASMVS